MDRPKNNNQNKKLKKEESLHMIPLTDNIGNSSFRDIAANLFLVSYFLRTEYDIHNEILYNKEELKLGIIAIEHVVKLGNIRADFKADTNNKEILIIEVTQGLGDMDALNQLLRRVWAFKIRRKKDDKNKNILPVLIAKEFTREVIDFSKNQKIRLKKYGVHLKYEDVV